MARFTEYDYQATRREVVGMECEENTSVAELEYKSDHVVPHRCTSAP
jgi:hypothetical protein